MHSNYVRGGRRVALACVGSALLWVALTGCQRARQDPAPRAEEPAHDAAASSMEPIHIADAPAVSNPGARVDGGAAPDGGRGRDSGTVSGGGDRLDGATAADASDSSASAGPPVCRGTHVVCGVYSGDEPTRCTRHGCRWQAGACSGTPHGCDAVVLAECGAASARHCGCAVDPADGAPQLTPEPQGCFGTHVPCSVFSGGDGAACTAHGCTFRAGDCSGSAHECTDVAGHECESVAANHCGCFGQ